MNTTTTTTTTPTRTLLITRQIFPTWWVSIPPGFREEMVDGDRYWHAWDEHRSVSLTSIVISDPRKGNRAVSAREIVARMPPPPGDQVELPKGLEGWGVIIDTPAGSRASSAITGMLAVEGRVLLATVTADDIAWATRIWRSICYAPEQLEAARPPRAGSAVMEARQTARRRH